MKNIEKIQAMSVGEFIEMFGHNGLCDVIQYYFKSHCEAHGVCDNCLWDFLESKVEE